MKKPLFMYQNDPLGFAREVLGFDPDPAQARVLEHSIRRGILCCTRGFGKTEITAILAAWHFVFHSNAVILVVSETAEKAGELVERARGWLEKAGFECRRDKLRQYGYRGANGARLLPVPCRGRRIRGYRATMILVDEAALVPDEVWMTVMGTMATTAETCRVWVMSTPGARRGFFYDLWMANDPAWTCIKVPATECPRISAAYLEEMRRRMSRADFLREFMAEFGDSEHQLFSDADQLNALRPDPASRPLDLSPEYRHRHALLGPRPLGESVLLATDEWVDRNGFILAADLGQARDHSALAIIEYRLDPLGWKDPLTLVPACTVKYVVRWLERLPLDTPYTDLSAIICDYTKHYELAGRIVLVIDATGVGRAFLDQLRSLKPGAQIIPVQFTGGHQVSQQRGFWNVPKGEPVMTLEQFFREGQILIPPALPLWPDLQAELRSFTRRHSATGHVTYSGKTPAGGTDDLVMALSLGAWVAHRKLRTAGQPDEGYRNWRKTAPRS